MGTLTFKKQDKDTVQAPVDADQLRLFIDLDGIVKLKDSSGAVRSLEPGTATSLATDDDGIVVDVSGSPAPSEGQVLTATGQSAAAWTELGPAAKLKTTGAPVTIDLSAPPVTGFVLTATTGTNAVWKPPMGALKPTAVVSNSTYLAAPGDLVLCNVLAGEVGVNLPAAHSPGDQIGVKMVSVASGQAVVIHPATAFERIDGDASLSLMTDYEWAILIWDGTNWRQIG